MAAVVNFMDLGLVFHAMLKTYFLQTFLTIGCRWTPNCRPGLINAGLFMGFLSSSSHFIVHFIFRPIWIIVIIRPNGSMQTGLHKTGRHCQTEYRKKREYTTQRNTKRKCLFSRLWFVNFISRWLTMTCYCMLIAHVENLCRPAVLVYLYKLKAFTDGCDYATVSVTRCRTLPVTTSSLHRSAIKKNIK